jgi:hypothetical protein
MSEAWDESLTPLKETLEPLEQHVTIYTGGMVWDRYQASFVRVYRARYAQYADAFHIEIKPKGKRRLGTIIDYEPKTIIIAGWDHPHVRPSILLPSGQKTLALSRDTITVGGPEGSSMNRIVDDYVRSLPLTDVILDLRGKTVATGGKW